MSENQENKSAQKRNVILLICLLTITILQTWTGSGLSEKEKPAISTTPSMELALFNWVARILIGSKTLYLEQVAKRGDEFPEDLKWIQRFGAIDAYLAPSIEDSSITEDVLIGKTILAGHENLRTQYAELRVKAGRRSSESKVDLLDLIDKVYGQADKNNTLSKKYLLSISESVEQKLGWIGKILILDGIAKTYSTEAQLELNVLYEEAQHKAVVFGGMLITAVLLLGIGAIALLTWIVKIAFRDFHLAGTNISIPSNQLCEIFIIYLAALNVLFYLTSHLDTDFESRLQITSIGTLSLSLVALYPLFKGSRIKETLTSIGLLPVPSIKSLFAGPIFVAAMWPIFTAVLSFYQSFLTKLNIDLTQGEHPVVPVFLSSDSQHALLWLFLFAAVVAPIVEEIMFRGALYGWLRNNYGKFVSMLVSAFIFAIVHPQGALGIVPLSLIGCGLAFIREWRGSLTPCMLAHSLVNTTVLTIIYQLR
jgi:membrane protease YdiL (CAAX protease family)